LQINIVTRNTKPAAPSSGIPLLVRKYDRLRRGIPIKASLLIGAIILFFPTRWSLAGILGHNDVNSWMLLGFTIISALAYGMSLWLLPRSIAPFIFILLFLISYPLRVPMIESDIDLYTVSGGHISIGNFDFSTKNYQHFYAVSIVGLGGLLFGSIAGTCLTSGRRKSYIWEHSRWLARLRPICLNWVCFSVIVAAICFFLKIGISGVEPSRLPFKLTGVLNFSRSFMLPMAGWFIFGLAYERGAYRLCFWLLIFHVLLGLAAVYLTLSKAGLMYAILPLLAYLAFRAPLHALTWKILGGTIAVLLSFLPLTYFGAMVLRDESIVALSEPLKDSFRRVLSEHGAKKSSFVEDVGTTLAHLTARVTGGSELMAIAASHEYPRETVLGLVAGRAADLRFGAHEIFLDIFNVHLFYEDNKFSGKAFGFFGALYLSHDLFFVFAGAAFFTIGIIWVESLARRHMNQALAAGLSFWLVLAGWESGFDTLWLYLPLLAAFFILTRVIHRRSLHLAARVP